MSGMLRAGLRGALLGLALIPALSPGQAGAPGEQDAGAAVTSIKAAVDEADGLIAAGNHEAAIELLEARLDDDSMPDADRALLHTRLAIGHYYRRDTEAIRQHAETAIDLVADDPDARGIHADALSARALYYGEAGDTEGYLEASRAELAVRRELPPAESELSIPLINIAIAHGENGDFAAAERHLREALDYALEYEADTNRATGIRTNLAWVYGMRREYRAAARMLRAVIETGRETAPGSVNLANRLSNLGSILRSLGRHEEAGEALEEALAIQETQVPDSLDMARTQYALGQVAEAQGRAADAERFYREALAIVDKHTPNSPMAAFPRRSLGGLLIDRDRLDQAEDLLEQALALTGPAKRPGGHASTLFQLGRLALAREDRATARQHWHAAVDALEVQYDLLGGSSLTVANFSEAYKPLYRRYAQLLIDDGDYLEALRLLESYRNRALLERLDVNRLLRESEAGKRLLSDLEALRRQTGSLLADAGEAGVLPDGISGHLSELRRQRAGYLARAIAAQPRLAALVNRERDWHLADLDLTPGQRIAYYSLGEKRSDLLVVGPDGITARRLPAAAEIGDRVERFRLLLQRPDADTAPLAALAGELHALLLAPAAAELSGADTLLVRADGPLLLLPFAALRDGDDRYLVETYRIRHLHSLRHDTTGPEGQTAFTTFTGFAFPGDAGAGPDTRGKPGRLRHVFEEVERAATFFGEQGEQHAGEAATESLARRTGKRGILHFASHAVVDPVEPMSSYISLAPGDGHDGRLELWEIMADLRLEAGLVVLSACETALGPAFAGEGLFGLSKGFSFAGAESVMASLWAIDDASTRHLIAAFYRELVAGRSPAEALRRAQMAMLSGDLPERGWFSRLFSTGPARDYTHPYYWAPFTLTTTR